MICFHRKADSATYARSLTYKLCGIGTLFIMQMNIRWAFWIIILSTPFQAPPSPMVSFDVHLDDAMTDHVSWPMTHDQWLMTNDQWLMTNDQWLMTNDSWLMTNERHSSCWREFIKRHALCFQGHVHCARFTNHDAPFEFFNVVERNSINNL